MEEDLTVIGTLRKLKLNESEGYLRRCPLFVTAGFRPSCLNNCRICDGSRRLSELLKFYSKRDCVDRPERKFLFFGLYMLKNF